MPDLDSKMHLKMLEGARKRGWVERDGIYGLNWGDPDVRPKLRDIRDNWLLPYVRPGQTALEIGPGGGRWTRYMLPFQRIYVVDYHKEMLAELRRNFPQPHIVEVHNSGTDFPGVPPASIDFVFSYGTFVHLDAHLIKAYLENLRDVVRAGSQIVIQYSDKDKKEAQEREGFSDNDPRRMRTMVEGVGFRVVEEDTVTLSHSSLMRFTSA